MSIPHIASYPLPTRSVLPKNRVDWRPDPARAALLIHDMQDYFLDYYDRAAAPVPQLIEHITALRTAADAAGMPVYYTVQPAVQSTDDRGLLNDWWGPGITARPDAAGVVAELAPRPTDTVLTKWRYSAFSRSDFAERLRAQGRSQLVVCGVYAHIGVQITAVDAFMHDLRVFVASDGVADFSPGEHADALDWIARRCGVVLPTAILADALTTQADSRRRMRADVAALIDMEPGELADDVNLFDVGLDSIRLMSLIERWKPAPLGFADFAETPTLSAWTALFDRTYSNAP